MTQVELEQVQDQVHGQSYTSAQRPFYARALTQVPARVRMRVGQEVLEQVLAQVYWGTWYQIRWQIGKQMQEQVP